jgi:hypothetical protein
MQWAGDPKKEEAACAQGTDKVEKPKRARRTFVHARKKQSNGMELVVPLNAV